MSAVTWFAADMCAPFEVLLEHWKANGNSVRLRRGPADQVTDTLRRNGFLSRFEVDPLPDNYRTSIPLQTFGGNADAEGLGYLRDNVFNRPELTRIEHGYRRELLRSMGEIFSNIGLHASTTIASACGQLYPGRRLLSVAVSDGGVGIPSNVRTHRHFNLPDPAAIDWATQEGSTTRKGPGGIGLWLLKKFVEENGVALTVVSGRGHWLQRPNGPPELRILRHPYPGTCVHWIIDVDERKTYRLPGV